jgi:site-specific DNA-methyltransferase (adenine-specific)
MESAIIPAWKNGPGNMGNRLHTICSYMAMFPPSIPNYFIRKYSEPGNIVLDPFSGRGTAPLEACVLGRLGIGNDKNPLAFVLTAAKVDVPPISEIIARIRTLSEEYKLNNDATTLETDWKINMLFSDYTLKQLCFLREKLLWRSDSVDTFITAMILGIMHGNTDGYLSIKMPNTFSMAPNYVKNYIENHHLDRPKRDVFYSLLKKLERCYQVVKIHGKAYNEDARNLTQIADSSVNLIVTSPPYTRVIRYGDFNWIRLWFLKNKSKEVDKSLFCSASLTKYKEFMSEIFEETSRVLEDEGTAIFVIGDVKDKEGENSINLAQYIWEEVAKPKGFSLQGSILEDRIDDTTKVSKIWGDTRGQATKIDRILLLKKS